MKHLYDIKNYVSDYSVPLYITQDGDYVLEGKFFVIKIGRTKQREGYLGSVLDDVAQIINLLESKEWIETDPGSKNQELKYIRQKIAWRKVAAKAGYRGNNGHQGPR